MSNEPRSCFADDKVLASPPTMSDEPQFRFTDEQVQAAMRAYDDDDEDDVFDGRLRLNDTTILERKRVWAFWEQ